MLALTDGVGLDEEQAKAVMLDAGRWLLAGALAELHPLGHTSLAAEEAWSSSARTSVRSCS